MGGMQQGQQAPQQVRTTGGFWAWRGGGEVKLCVCWECGVRTSGCFWASGVCVFFPSVLRLLDSQGFVVGWVTLLCFFFRLVFRFFY